MASPYVTSHSQHQPPMERPWLGMALLVALPLLALILIRMLWSGSGLWFLTVGIILLGLAAVIFLARRPQERDYGTHTLAEEPNRLPLVLAGLGVLFLAMLLLPNFAGGGEDAPAVQDLTGLSSDVSGSVQQPQVQQPQTQNPAVEQPAASEPDAGTTDGNTDAIVPDGAVADGEVYVVQDGDTLWDISLQFDVSVEALVEANGLEDETSISIDQELVIPASDASTTGSGE